MLRCRGFDGHYELMSLINEVRSLVNRRRSESDQTQWGVTPETARLFRDVWEIESGLAAAITAAVADLVAAAAGPPP